MFLRSKEKRLIENYDPHLVWKEKERTQLVNGKGKVLK